MITIKKILCKDKDGKWKTLTDEEIKALSGDGLDGLIIKCGDGSSYKMVAIK